MRGILRAALIGSVVLGSVTVADEVRATPGTGVTPRTVWMWTVGGTDHLMREPRSRLGRDEQREPLVLDVVYATPHGKPISVDAPDPHY